METATNNIIDFTNKIEIAANYNNYDLNGNLHDPNYKAFLSIMMYRKKIAIDILKKHDEQTHKFLEESFINCNDKIKQILGL